VPHGKPREVNAFKAPGVDDDHGIPRENAFGKCMNATAGAEAVLDVLLAEGIGGDIFFRRKQMETIRRNAPQERTFLRADGAVALRDLGKLAFNLESHLAAVTATFAFHLWLLTFVVNRTRATRLLPALIDDARFLNSSRRVGHNDGLAQLAGPLDQVGHLRRV
jgi:hypothetical protein